MSWLRFRVVEWHDNDGFGECRVHEELLPSDLLTARSPSNGGPGTVELNLAGHGINGYGRQVFVLGDLDNLRHYLNNDLTWREYDELTRSAFEQEEQP